MVASKQRKDPSRHCIILTIISFLLLTVAIISVYGSPMAGYETSVYGSTPLIFWVAIVAGLIVGALTFYVNYGRSKGLWAIGLFQILLTNFVLITLYIFKGFVYLNRSDSLTYIAFAKDVVDSGSFGSNFYPAISMLMAAMGGVTGQDMITMSQIIPAIFFSAYTLGMVCWALSLSKRPEFVTSMMLASMPIFFAWFIPSLYHEAMAALMLPFFFGVLWKSFKGDARFKVLAGLLIVFFTVGHPLVAVSVILFLTVIWMVNWMTKRKESKMSFSLILFSVVVMSGWIAYHYSLVRDLTNILDQLLGMGGDVSTFSSAAGQASQLSILSVVQSIVACTIDDMIFALLALVVGLIILRAGWKKHPLTPIMACFLAGMTFLGVMILFTYTHNPYRMINLNFMMVLTVPLVGYLLCVLRKRPKQTLHRALSALVLVSLVSTVFTVYQDPAELFPNVSISRSEIAGNHWFIDEHGDHMTIYTTQTNPWRFADLIHGLEYRRDDPDIRYNESDVTRHFGSFLEANGTVGKINLYLVVSSYDRLAYTDLWKESNKFNQGDFDTLQYSHLVNTLYSGRDFAIYSRTG